MNFEAYKAHILDELEPAKNYQHNKYICPICGSGTGKNRTAALSVNADYTAHCYACNFHGDIFDLYAARDKVDADTARQRVIDKYGSSPAGIQRSTGNRQRKGAAAPADFTAYIEKAAAALKGSDGAAYLERRGISAKTAAAFRLGYDADRRAIVIPYPQENYYITRSLEGKEYRKPAGLAEPIYNAAALQADCVFITEGQLDALSIEEAGGAACAIGGSGARKLQGMTIQGRAFIFADADEAGAKTAQRIKETLEEAGAAAPQIISAADFDGCKDANDLLRTNRAALEKMVKDAQQGAEQDAQEYEAAAAGCFAIDLFDTRARTYSTSTGFAQIDAALGGGLYEGLYVLGAVSSLGKTTLALQIADQIAQGGTDVLFFSLEMQREELIAKSVSRLTYDLCGGNTRNAKTTRGLTDPLRQSNYSAAEWDLVAAAIERYAEYGARIWIDEGLGTIGTAQIEQRIEEHIQKRGKKPVVFIDYLQILASPDPRMTDKQATDRNVFNLKRISRKHKLAIIAISSLNRDNYAQGMNMAAFKESGAIEYSSDVLMGLQPQGMKDGTLDRDRSDNRQTLKETKAAQTRALEFVILKNRHGAANAAVPMDYIPAFNRFTESSGD